MLQPWQIERCRAIIASDHAINFEVRMVAEIHLYWTVYEHLIHESVDLLKSVAALQTWRRKWEFVLGISPPIETCYHRIGVADFYRIRAT